jgi:xanthine phosphoribosyltransferase
MLRYSYKELISDLKEMLPKLKSQKYDTILAVARGGMSMAHILGESLDIRDVYSVNAIGYDDTKKLDNVRIFNIPQELKNSKKVLIVDDISDSGDTLYSIDKLLLDKYEDIQFDTYTLFYKSSSRFEPTYYSKEAKEWIEFYWSEQL